MEYSIEKTDDGYVLWDSKINDDPAHIDLAASFIGLFETRETAQAEADRLTALSKGKRMAERRDNRSPIWGGATLGLIIGLIVGIIRGSIGQSILAGIIIGAVVGSIALLLGVVSDRMKSS